MPALKLCPQSELLQGRVNTHPSSMRSCLLLIKCFCSVFLQFLNVCFLNFATGKTPGKGRVRREGGRQELKIKIWQNTDLRRSPGLSESLPGAHLEGSSNFQDTDFHAHVKQSWLAKSADFRLKTYVREGGQGSN